jgi:TonB family protein
LKKNYLAEKLTRERNYNMMYRPRKTTMKHMRNDSIFLSMIGLSAVFHGLALICVPGNGFRTQHPAQEVQFAQTLRMIKVGTTPQKIAPSTPIENKIFEKIIEPTQEVPSIAKAMETEEAASREIARGDGDAEEGDGGHDEKAQEGGGGEDWRTERVPEGGTMTDHEYEALLAYIKDFIEKNLVYPPMARRRNVEGVVGVSFEIGRNGALAAVMVDRSSCSSILDNAAVSLVNRIHLLENITIKRKLDLRVNIEYKLTE